VTSLASRRTRAWSRLPLRRLKASHTQPAREVTRVDCLNEVAPSQFPLTCTYMDVERALAGGVELGPSILRRASRPFSVAAMRASAFRWSGDGAFVTVLPVALHCSKVSISSRHEQNTTGSNPTHCCMENVARAAKSATRHAIHGHETANRP
jgi:hypothetical protein